MEIGDKITILPWEKLKETYGWSKCEGEYECVHTKPILINRYSYNNMTIIDITPTTVVTQQCVIPIECVVPYVEKGGSIQIREAQPITGSGIVEALRSLDEMYQEDMPSITLTDAAVRHRERSGDIGAPGEAGIQEDQETIRIEESDGMITTNTIDARDYTFAPNEPIRSQSGRPYTVVYQNTGMWEHLERSNMMPYNIVSEPDNNNP